MKRRRPRDAREAGPKGRLSAPLIILAFMLASIPARAAIPGAGGLINACYAAGTGHLRVVDSDNPACAPGVETPLTWSQSGSANATNLECAGCVGTGDLADSAVTAPKIASGAVGTGHLSFDPATQLELDAHKGSGDHDGRYPLRPELSGAGVINTAGNPLHWTKLLGVPAGFADGIDDTGGTASDVVCSACVGASDLAPGAVAGGIGGILADGTVTLADLAAATIDALRPRSAAHEDTTGGGTTLTGSGVVQINSTTITVGVPGRLIVSGNVFVNNNSTSERHYQLIPRVNGTAAYPSVFASIMNAGPHGSMAELVTLAYTASVSVGQGTHTVSQDLGPLGAAADFFYNANELTVMFVPN